MVRILKNGEIVDDSDPRAQRGSKGQQQNIGREQRESDDVARRNGGQGGRQYSVFDEFNARLVRFGVPRFNIGSHTVEPIVLIGFIVAGLLFGLPGLLLVAMLFVISKLSTSGGGIKSFFGGQGGQGDSRSSGSRSTQGSGHRLGTS